MKMNKKTRDMLSEITGLNKKEAETVLGAFSEMIYRQLKEDGECTIPGIGKLEVKERAERMGINPSTKEKIVIPATKQVKFKPCKLLKDSFK